MDKNANIEVCKRACMSSSCFGTVGSKIEFHVSRVPLFGCAYVSVYLVLGVVVCLFSKSNSFVVLKFVVVSSTLE